MLSVDNLSISFLRYDGIVHRRETAALENIDLTIDRGEILALVGASGAGKSLLAHALFGILPANAIVRGSVCVDGSPLAGASRDHARARMALVPQSLSHLDPLARCGRQLRWAARRAGVAGTMPHLLKTLDGFGLGPDVMGLYPHQVSGGMGRRLMLAMATIAEPELIVADEPTSGLDPDAAGVVLGHLRRLASNGKAVLLITHDLVTAVSHADRVAMLKNGRMVGIEQADAFCDDGAKLAHPYARALWLAMPGNRFAIESQDREAANA